MLQCYAVELETHCQCEGIGMLRSTIQIFAKILIKLLALDFEAKPNNAASPVKSEDMMVLEEERLRSW